MAEKSPPIAPAEEWTVREDLKMDTNRLLFGLVEAPRSSVCAWPVCCDLSELQVVVNIEVGKDRKVVK